MTIGAKANALCDAAKSEIIAHFDDDHFYGHAESSYRGEDPEPRKDVTESLTPRPELEDGQDP